MAAIFVDIDGTCFFYHEQRWLPGVVDKLTAWAAEGHQIHFITMRDIERDTGTSWSVEGTLELLNALPFAFHFTSNVSSPRILVDDMPAFAAKVTTNDSTTWPNIQ